MTKDEALKMAIAYLEGDIAWLNLHSHVLKTCKEALEQPAQDCQYGKDVGMPEYSCAGKCQYAQPAQDDIIEEQRKTIEALNMCIGGEGSTTTENITRIGRLEAEIESLKQPVKPPKWYRRDEFVELLRKMNYSTFIQEELADLFLRHCQYAFNKGFQKAIQERVILKFPPAPNIAWSSMEVQDWIDKSVQNITPNAPSCRCEECGMKYCECGERKCGKRK